MRERVEAEIDSIIAPYFEALKTAVVHATYEGEVLTSTVPDLGARIAAAEKLLDRVYGRPRQSLEHSGIHEPPVPIELSEAAREKLHDLLRTRPMAPRRDLEVDAVLHTSARRRNPSTQP
jgi:hypothetical protein